MHPVSLTRRLSSVLAAGLIALAGMNVPAADSREHNLVVLGDSVVADPSLPDYLSSKVGRAFPQIPGSSFEHCPTSPGNFGARAAAKLGLRVADFSCTGATSFSPGQPVSAQVDRAVASGALSPATSRVILSTGFNDTYSNSPLSDGELRARFVASTAPLIQRVRQAAPHARIQIVGYPTITDQGHVCLFHLLPGSSDRTPLAPVARWEWVSQDMQRDLAHATGTEFVDLKPSTVGRGMCGPDGQRHWAGLVDVTAGQANLPFHMTAEGHEHVANVIAAS